jgi:uncharacterized membrane protein YphA (DoxX/SURF4 family)
MTRWTIFFLILLRLAIGWHFLFEGVEKVKKPGWSSEAYLRESYGPLAPFFHKIAGNRLADRLTPAPSDEPDPTKVDPARRFPAALEKEWQAWFDRVDSQYTLTADQKERALDKVQKHRTDTAKWVLTGEVTVQFTSPYGPPAEVTKPVQEWLKASQDLIAQARELEEDQASRAGTTFAPEARARVQELKARANTIRATLLGALTQRTRAMQDSVAAELKPEQWQAGGALPTRVRPGLLSWSLLDGADFLVTWGLLIIGGCLILGLCTRWAAVVGALLLLSFYLAMPPWPWLPEPARVEGHYLFINKNIIEMLALLTLAAARAGRWGGLDGVFQFFRSRKGKETSRPGGKPEKTVSAVGAATGPG